MIKLSRSSSGTPILHLDKQSFENIKIVQAFPLQYREEQAISILNPEGKELAWIPHLNQLDSTSQDIIRETLNAQEIQLKIDAIFSISSKLYPSTWQVQTRRGLKTLTIENEEDFIHLNSQTIVIKSKEHIYYVLKDLGNMDKKSLQHLMPFIFHV